MLFESNYETGVIRMRGVIGDEITAEDFLLALDDMDGRDITIQLQSPGGEVTNGMSMYNAIEHYGGNVRVEIDSYAGSIATVFPMAADEIVANSNATLLIHKAWTIALGNSDELRLTAEVLEHLDQQIARAYSDRTGGDESEFLELMARETRFTASEALEIGLIDGIKQNKKKKPANLVPVATVSNYAALAAYVAPTEPRPRLARSRALAMALALRKTI